MEGEYDGYEKKNLSYSKFNFHNRFTFVNTFIEEKCKIVKC